MNELVMADLVRVRRELKAKALPTEGQCACGGDTMLVAFSWPPAGGYDVCLRCRAETYRRRDDVATGE